MPSTPTIPMTRRRRGTTSEHKSPLPGSMLTFTPAGGSPVTATASDAGDTTGKGKADDGLFDATYSFVVPGNLTTGNLTINAGTFTGAEFTLFTAEAGATTLNITAPLSLPLNFAAVPATATQPNHSGSCTAAANRQRCLLFHRRRHASVGLERVPDLARRALVGGRGRCGRPGAAPAGRPGSRRAPGAGTSSR